MAERTRPELEMNWSRTEGMLAIRSHGASVDDMEAVSSALSAKVLESLDARGYDLKTLRFSIRKKKSGSADE